jgi:hypothetical protein
VTEDFEFLNEARRRFHGGRFDNLYQSWRSGALSEVDVRLEFSQIRPNGAVFFSTCLVSGQGYPLAVNNGNGDGCIKDTHHPIRHRSRHPAGDAKLLGA